MSEKNNSVDSPSVSGPAPAPASAGSETVKRPALRVRKSVADMMSTSRPRSRNPWGAAVVLLLLLAGGIAAWWCRADWYPAVRAWVVAHRPDTPEAAPAAAPESVAEMPGKPAHDEAETAGDVASSASAELPEPPEMPETVALPDAPMAPAASMPGGRGARQARAPIFAPAAPAAKSGAPTPASLFNEALRDYQTFLTDKAAHADMLPDIIERAYQASRGFAELLNVVGDDQRPQINEALAQCNRLISDCRRQNTAAAKALQGASVSTHAPFNRATVGPKRQPPLRAPEPAPATAP